MADGPRRLPDDAGFQARAVQLGYVAIDTINPCQEGRVLAARSRRLIAFAALRRSELGRLPHLRGVMKRLPISDAATTSAKG